MKRRRFISSAVTAGLAASPIAAALSAGQTLSRTPQDYEGPFYPVGPRHRTNDLIRGAPRQAVLELSGRVISVDGDALAETLIDVWHTDPLGRYQHPRDTSPGERWSDFLYYGEARADTNGEFSFRTYLPGAYGRRPAHIHYKVWQGDRQLLTSQMYFSQTGGTQGASKNAAKADLQTIQLTMNNESLQGFLQIVI